MKKLRALLVAFALSCYASAAQAAPIKILFFYPGGQGSREAAQPLLDAFGESLKQASAGKIDSAVTYLSDPLAGLSFIKSEKPAVAIVSLDAFDQYASAWGAQVIAKTLQLPSGDGKDQFFIVGQKGSSLPTQGKITLLSSRPLSSDFVAKKLFPALQGVNFSIQSERNAIGTLRAIGSGEKSDFILLDQFEYANVKRLRSAWVAGLDALAESQKVSSAPVIVFPQQISSELIPVLQKSLVKLGQESSAQPTLQELRLKGFMPAQNVD